MRALKNFENSRIFRIVAYAAAGLIAIAVSIAAARWSFHAGYVLYYGDAEAHLNIARRILDSKTPGAEQIGTGWLPLLHVVLIPFVMHSNWWQTGVAGAIPTAACYAIAAIFLFAAAERALQSPAAAFTVMAIFLLNPSMRYLGTTPMTEPLFAAAFAALLFATLWFRDSQSIWAIILAAVASNAASLTRYEGWFVIPFVCLYLLLAAKNKWLAVLFGALASLGPLAWMAHNRFYEGDPLEFYRGQWSALGIYRRQLAQGMMPYPGDHDWRKAIQYYWTAVKLAVGLATLALAAVGIFAAFWKRAWWPVVLLTLPPIFYVMGMHSAGNPIFVPTLFPFSWYNTRYALAALPLAAFCAGALVMFAPGFWKWLVALAVIAIPAFAWGLHPESICWKESEVNSVVRREWTAKAASFLKANYRPGDGIIFPFGDMTGVLREAGIPLRESLFDGNGPVYTAALENPDFFLKSRWALAFSGDPIATAILRAGRRGPRYQLMARIMVKGAPVVEIYHRERGRIRAPAVCEQYVGQACAPKEEPTR